MSIQISGETQIRDQLKQLIENPNEFGFNAYAIARICPHLRKMALDEGRIDASESYKHRVKQMIVAVIGETYLLDDAEYISGSHVGDNQHKFYMIPQTDGYAPFGFLEPPEIGQFKFEDINEITGIIFELRHDDYVIWAYQHLWSIMVPNKKRSHLLTRVMRLENVDVIAEQKEPLLTIARKVDLLVMHNTIVTSNISLLQSYFGFQKFIRIAAGKAIERITDSGIAKNPEKLRHYINRRGNTYAKKMMRISDSAVLQLSPEEIIERINAVDRWKSSFEVEDSKIVLKNFSQVEALIDLLDERYTRSDITSREYDTDVKRIITSA